MAGLSISQKLNLIDDIVHLSQTIQGSGGIEGVDVSNLNQQLIGLLNNLNAAQPHKQLTEYIHALESNTAPSDFHSQLQLFLNNVAGIQRSEARNLDELKAEYTKSQQQVASTIDSHNLQQILENRKTSVHQAEKIYQLREVVKSNIQNAILADTTFVQGKDMLASRETQAYLEEIISSLSLDPHKDLSAYSMAVVERLRTVNDRRLRTLAKHANLDNVKNTQALIENAVKNNPEAAEGFELIRGEKTSKFRESLESSVVRNNAQNGSLAVKEQLSSILKEAGVTDMSILDNIEGHLLSNTSINTQTARTILQQQMGASFSRLSADYQTHIINTFIVNFEAAGFNPEIAALRADIAAEGLTAEQLNQNLLTQSDGILNSSHLFADAYRSHRSTPSFGETANDRARIDHAATNIQELVRPENQPFFNTRTNTSETVKLWRSHYRDPFKSTLSNQNVFSTTPPEQVERSGALAALRQRAQLLREGGKFLFEPLGKGLRRLNLSPLGSGVRSVGFRAATFLRDSPEVWQGMSQGMSRAQFLFNRAIATSDVAPQKWARNLMIAFLVLFVIVIPMVFVGPIMVAQTNLTPVGAGGNAASETASFKAIICTPDEPDCPASMCTNCKNPVTCGCITQGPGEVGTTHENANAVDFGVGSCSKAGLGVYSQVPGVISTIKMSYNDGSGYKGSSQGYGNYIDVTYTDPKTGRKFILRYGHLSNQARNGIAQKIQVGQAIAPGQLLGYADHTGNSTGPHLHFELLATDGGKVPSINTLVSGSKCK